MNKFVLAFVGSLLSVVSTLSWGADVGSVVLATGQAYRMSGELKTPLKRGDSVSESDVLVTEQGNLIVRMVDKGLLSLRENTKVAIKRYRAGEAPAVQIDLSNGTLRSATGQIGQNNKSSFRVNSPFSALGVRGTDFVTKVSQSSQQVYVVDGAVALSGYGENCLASTLGECAGSAALKAGVSDILTLPAGEVRAQTSPLKDLDLLPAKFEINYFDGQFNSLLGTGIKLSSGAGLTNVLLDASGRAIEPFHVSTYRSVFDPESYLASVGLLPQSQSGDISRNENFWAKASLLPAFKERMMLDGLAADTDRDGVDDLVELARGLNPWDADTDHDGVFDLVDPQPRNSVRWYWYDSDATPVTEEVFRRSIQDLNVSFSVYDARSYGQLALFSAETLKEGSLSFWLDAGNHRLWGQRLVLETMAVAKDFPEFESIFSGVNQKVQQVGLKGSEWVSSLPASGPSDLYLMPLDGQAIAFSPVAADQLLNGQNQQYEVQFIQPLFAGVGGGINDALKAPSFQKLEVGQDSFTLHYTVNGVEQSLTGAVSDGEAIFARNEQLQVVGVRGASSVLLMVDQNGAINQWMLGYGQNGLDADGLVDPTLTSVSSASGITWGRWENFASLSVQDLAKVLPQVAVSNSKFALASPVELNLPDQGLFKFRLSDYEGVYSNLGKEYPLQLSNSFLQIDFGSDRFVTSFDVSAPGLSAMNIKGAGAFGANGVLVADQELSNARLGGVLGPNGNSAGLLFEKNLSTGSFVSGVTSWER